MSTEIVFEVKRTPTPRTEQATSSATTSTRTESAESTEPCPPREKSDISATLASLRDVVPKIREAINELKDAEVYVKDWAVTVGNRDDQYILDLSLKVAVTPKNVC